MIDLLFVVFLFASLITAGLGIAKRNFFFFVLSGLLFIFLGTILISEGISIVYYGSYGFLNNTTAVTGVATSTTIVHDVWINGFGFFFWILGIYLIISALLPTGDSTPKGRRL